MSDPETTTLTGGKKKKEIKLKSDNLRDVFDILVHVLHLIGSRASLLAGISQWDS